MISHVPVTQRNRQGIAVQKYRFSDLHVVTSAMVLFMSVDLLHGVLIIRRICFSTNLYGCFISGNVI